MLYIVGLTCVVGHGAVPAVCCSVIEADSSEDAANAYIRGTDNHVQWGDTWKVAVDEYTPKKSDLLCLQENKS